MGVCMCGFCNVWVFVCVDFVMCGFCNVWVCVCVCFVICVCFGKSVYCVLYCLYCVLCIVSFMYIYSYLFFLY